MGVISGVKKVFKIIKIIIGLAIVGLIVFVAIKMFGGKVENAEVSAANTYTETNDAGNGSVSTAEVTGITLNGEDWIELKGIYNDYEDKDMFQLNVDPALFETDSLYRVSVVGIVDGEVQSKIGMVNLPIFANSINAEGGRTLHLAIGLARYIEIKEGTVALVINSHGKAMKNENGSIIPKYGNGNSYSIKLK